MKRRDFIQKLFAGAAVAVASFYVPSKPWSVAVLKPATPQGGFWVPERLAQAIVRLEDGGFIRDPRAQWAGITGHWPDPGPGDF